MLCMIAEYVSFPLDMKKQRPSWLTFMVDSQERLVSVFLRGAGCN